MARLGDEGKGRLVTWRNERNGDVVEYREDSLSGRRCDELPNWHRIAGDDAGEPAADEDMSS